MSKSRKSLCLSQQLQSMSMEEEKDKYLYKQQELDALTDEMTELYRAQNTMETKLDRILPIISNEPQKVEEMNRHVQERTTWIHYRRL